MSLTTWIKGKEIERTNIKSTLGRNFQFLHATNKANHLSHLHTKGMSVFKETMKIHPTKNDQKSYKICLNKRKADSL